MAATAQLIGVPAGPTGQVEHRAGRSVRQAALDEGDVTPRLFRVPVRIEVQVILAEPLSIPGHGPAS